mmetsp:Transcript_96089/g.200733  ORF Transcript_96089/g.200733 Transcript_96089/m.200733 type:complete len:398 (-) Transcript_96089:196-1389(-)
MAAAKPHVVVVGAGVTGSALALFLKDAGLQVSVLEKSKGAGGRMATHRRRAEGASRDSPILSRADLGAQYITTRSQQDHSVLGPLYSSMLEQGVLRRFGGQVDGPNPYGQSAARNYIAPEGMQSISEWFLKESEAKVHFDTLVKSLDVEEDKLRMEVVTDGGGSNEVPPSLAEPPSILVLTQPLPQVLGKSKFGLTGNFKDHLSAEVRQDLEKADYSSRFALAYFFDKSKFQWPFPWTVRYFADGDVKYVSCDSNKRAGDRPSEEDWVSILVHSSVPMGLEFQNEAAPFEAATSRMQADIEAKLPEIPWKEAGATKVHKWLYSQVYKSIGEKRPSPDWVWDPEDREKTELEGCVPLLKTSNTLVLLAGDALAPSANFEGCVFSASRAAAAVKQHMQM